MHTWNMNVEKIERKITDKTKAIMMVHLCSLPVEVYGILYLTEKYDLKIIEDATEAHGQTYHGKPCGRFVNVKFPVLAD